uniref:Reverse transcriptase Ty1/copia-type domain-containing protein n=1 Tax=Fagus sylvatica TaxID=28930 RepID=A0A2N9GKV8_FAGSY
MASKFNALQRQQTWSLVPPSNQNVIGCRWVYKIKRNTDGSVSRYKARLVAKGFHQQAEVDFDEMFSPVVKPPTVRIILSLATQNQRSLRQLDVNDIIITGNNLTAISNIISQLSIAFELKDLDLLHKLNMIDCKAASTPIATTHILTTTTADLLSDPTPYQSLVRALQYATLTRPDISFVVNHVCQFMHKPSPAHFVAAKHILRYLKGTLDKGILFQPGLIALTAFTNADWAGDPCDMRSTSDIIVFLGNNLITWLAKKQHVVSRSFIEAEYRSLASGAAELSWIRQVLCDLGLFLPSAPLIWCDNTNALALASNPVFHGFDKGILFQPGLIALTAFTNADWAGDPCDMRSTSGIIVFLGNNLITWLAKKQHVVSRSFTEAEYRSLSSGAAELSWIRQVLCDLGLFLPSAPLIWCDNTNALALASNPIFHGRTKHIETAFLRAEEWKTCKRITAGRNWHRFGAGQRGSDAFVSIDSQKNLESEFLYWKVLFIPEERRENGLLYLLFMARGLPGIVGSEDTWCINSPSPGRPVLVWFVVLCGVHGLGPLDSWKTPVAGGTLKGSQWRRRRTYYG